MELVIPVFSEVHNKLHDLAGLTFGGAIMNVLPQGVYTVYEAFNDMRGLKVYYRDFGRLAAWVAESSEAEDWLKTNSPINLPPVETFGSPEVYLEE